MVKNLLIKYKNDFHELRNHWFDQVNTMKRSMNPEELEDDEEWQKLNNWKTQKFTKFYVNEEINLDDIDIEE